MQSWGSAFREQEAGCKTEVSSASEDYHAWLPSSKCKEAKVTYQKVQLQARRMPCMHGIKHPCALLVISEHACRYACLATDRTAAGECRLFKALFQRHFWRRV